VKPLQALRRRRSESEPARKQRPARAGAAPREGKALEGSSRDASGESPARGANKPAKRRGPRRKPRACRNRREGRNPEDGTDEGLAILVPHVRPRGRAGGEGAPDVVVSVGARTSREVDPRGPEEGRGGRRRGSQHSGEDRTPGGETAAHRPRGWWFAVKVRRGRPRGRRDDVGGAPEASKALLAGYQTP